MKKLTAFLLFPCAIALLAGCRSPKPAPVTGIRTIETIEMTEARVNAQSGKARNVRSAKEKPAELDPEVADEVVTEDLLPEEAAPVIDSPELDAEGDWVEGELPGLPEPIATPSAEAGGFGSVVTEASDVPAFTEPQVGEWRTPEGIALPPEYNTQARAPEPTRSAARTPGRRSSTEAAAEARRAAAARIAASRASAATRAAEEARVAAMAPEEIPEIPPTDSGDYTDAPATFPSPDEPFRPSFLPIPSFEDDDDGVADPAPASSFPSVTVPGSTQANATGLKAATASETIMVGSRPVTLNFVNGEWVGPQGETYSQLPIVGELLPRYGN